MKLKKPLLIKNFGAEERKIEEINIKKEDFTAKVIIDAEQNFLMSNGIFPTEGMHNSRKFLTFVLAELLEVRYDNLLELDGEDLISITDEIKNFFGASALEKIVEMFSVKQGQSSL
ncbi:hypothetical protein [uncultured Fusobacterium sp.]|uniref:hypothetical protein n=1 Tax=uncultured Fusobacterium sp. TaxID=159267 RepID=UPI0025F474CB|nr:hypothetical protein [uncultured Fusobacterium sp.]